jgi:2-methylcitrate dehydratase PrpD
MGTTRDLAQFAVETQAADIPAEVRHDALRDAINVIGVAVYSAKDPSLKHLTNMFEAEGSNPRAAIWAAGVKTSLQNAALANGYLAHLEDYDDTHFPTVLHPSAPTVPAAFAIAEERGLSGRDFVTAVALGVEVSCRLCIAVHPWHYDEGWHITGTFGTFGGVTAAGRTLGLNADQMVAAFGIGGAQAAGVREAFGSMTKPMHAGRAAQAGVNAALLAASGFTSAEAIIEGRRGYVAVASPDADLSRATDRLGDHWEMRANGLKPYACGVVSHASIDAAVALRDGGKLDTDAITAIDVDVHPLVRELMFRPDPRVGLEGKFSCQHAIAAGLLEGAAGPAQFSDAKVIDPKFAALRSKVTFIDTPSYEEEEALMRITMADGSVLEKKIDHCTGSPHNPMSDEFLSNKFLALAAPTLGDAGARELLEKLWALEEAPSLAHLGL